MRVSLARIATLTLWLGVLACLRDDGARPNSSSKFRPASVGDTLPPITGRTLDGRAVAVGAGHPLTLVNVWTTWCTSCRDEMADVVALARELDAKGVRVLAVSVDEGSDDRVRAFLRDNRIGLDAMHDQAGNIERSYRMVGVPETFLVDGAGVLRWHHVGNIRPVIDDVRNAVQATFARR